MQALAQGIQNAMDNEDTDLLEKAGKKWAIESLNLFSGKLRKRALRISESIMDFIDEYNAHKQSTGAEINFEDIPEEDLC